VKVQPPENKERRRWGGDSRGKNGYCKGRRSWIITGGERKVTLKGRRDRS